MLISKSVEPSDVDVVRATELFAALAEPARVRILAVLSDGPRCVCDIRNAVAIPANLLSYHLRILREAGIIEGHRRGRWIHYRLGDAAADLIAGALSAAGLAASVDCPPTSPLSAYCSTPSGEEYPMTTRSPGPAGRPACAVRTADAVAGDAQVVVP